MNVKVRALYHNLKQAHLGRLASVVPERYWSNFVCIGGAAEHLYILRRLLGKPNKPLSILVVGVFGGRDLWGLIAAGHQVVGFDLDTPADCPGTVSGDAEQPWPFASAVFDVVILGEILEHLIKDHFALTEAHRVLAPCGRLVVTVPFLHDSVQYHVRVHTPASIDRLLRSAGFNPLDTLERPGLLPLKYVNFLTHVVSAISYRLSRRTVYQQTIALIGYIEWTFGHARWLPRSYIATFMPGINWGATIMCEAVSPTFDYKELNRSAFGGTRDRAGLACAEQNQAGAAQSH